MIRVKKINYLKFSLDLLMAVVFVLFFNKRVLGGLTFHEIAGLTFAAMYFTHVLLNWRWVKNVTLKLFDKKLPGKTKFGYLLNLFLLVTMSFIVISGIFISRVVFPDINVWNERWFKITHISISFLVLILVAAHVGLHWKWVMNVFNKMIKAKKSGRNRGILVKVTIITLLVVGCYEIYSTHFMNRLAGVSQVWNYSTSQTKNEKFHGGERHVFQDRGIKEEIAGIEHGNFKDRENLMGFKGGKIGNLRSANVMEVLFKYLSIMSLFVIITYYLDNFLLRFKNKRGKKVRID